MKILYALDSPYAFAGGCWLYRQFLPGEALKAKGHTVKYMALGNTVAQEWLNYPDVVIFTRVYPIDPIIAVRQFKRMGKKVVYEIDDDLWHVNPDNPSVSVSTEKRRQYEILMSEVDAITTTTEELAKLLRKFNKNVYVCPNSITYDIWHERAGNNDVLRIGYTGASSHWADLSIVTKALLKLRDKYDFVFHIQGMSGQPIECEMYGYQQILRHGLVPEQTKYMTQALDWFNDVRELKFYHTPFYPPELYPKTLASVDIDIGIAPLIDNTFNHSKSCVKFYEYSAVGTVTLASDVLPYNKEVGYCAKNTEKDWYRKLEKLIVDEKFRKKLLEKQQKWVREHRDMNKVVDLWEEAFDPKNL